MGDETGCLTTLFGVAVLFLLGGLLYLVAQFVGSLTSADIWCMAGFFGVCAVLAIALHIVGKIYEK